MNVLYKLTPLAIEALAMSAASNAALYTTQSVVCAVQDAIEKYEKEFNVVLCDDLFCLIRARAVKLFDVLYRDRFGLV